MSAISSNRTIQLHFYEKYFITYVFCFMNIMSLTMTFCLLIVDLFSFKNFLWFFIGVKGESALTSIHDKGQKGEPGLDGTQGMKHINNIFM